MTDAFTISPHSKEFEPSPRWVRVYFNRQLIADSKKNDVAARERPFAALLFPEGRRTDGLSAIE